MVKHLYIRVLLAILILGSIYQSEAWANNHLEGFSPNVLTEINKLSVGEVQYFTKSRFEKVDTAKYKILKLEVPKEQRSNILNTLKSKVNHTEYQVFYTQVSFDSTPELVCVLRSADKYDILRALSTNGINYDIDTDQLIRMLAQWDRRYGIDIIGADGDWVEIKFHKLPKDVRNFAEEIYQFCPDSVDQGVGSVEALAKYIQTNRGVFLWWD